MKFYHLSWQCSPQEIKSIYQKPQHQEQSQVVQETPKTSEAVAFSPVLQGWKVSRYCWSHHAFQTKDSEVLKLDLG